MKQITTFLTLFLLSVSSFSQSLNKVAEELFKNVKTKLTVAEKNEIATKINFVLSGNKDAPFAADAESKEFPFSAFVYPTDINKDGKEDVFILFGNTYTSGNTGSNIALFIKNAAGKYEDHLGFPGTLPEALTTGYQQYPDLLIGGPGFEFPVLRWNGKTYNNYRKVKDSAYEKLKKTSVEELSKTYQGKISQ